MLFSTQLVKGERFLNYWPGPCVTQSPFELMWAWRVLLLYETVAIYFQGFFLA